MVRTNNTAVGARIAFVPLDDRPVDVYCPVMTAAIAGSDLVLPPRGLLGRFFEPGDGAAIADWLVSTDAEAYVISVSMLAYGGLIASRTAEPTPESARAHIEAIRAVRAARPDATILVHDTIQRLALTSRDADLERYRDLLVGWAMLSDQVDNLGRADLRSELDNVRAQIPDRLLEDYLAARARNHAINRQMVHWVADGTISHLVLSEDDTAPVGLERAERAQLEKLVAQLGVGEHVEIFPGADEVGALLVGRLVAGDARPRYRVEYSGVSGEEWTAELESIPYAENIRRHVASIGGQVVTGDADIVLAVHTPAGDLRSFVDRIAALLAAGERVIVVDPVFLNRADHDLVSAMESQIALLELLSFSGWNTSGNALGLALSHGTARWSFLNGHREVGHLDTTRAHVEYLLHRFVKDDLWKNVVQRAAYAEADRRGWNHLNLTAAQKSIFDDWVRERLVPLTQRYFAEHFRGRLIPLGDGRRARIDAVEGIRVELPWDRLFEVTLEPRVTLVAH